MNAHQRRIARRADARYNEAIGLKDIRACISNLRVGEFCSEFSDAIVRLGRAGLSTSEAVVEAFRSFQNLTFAQIVPETEFRIGVAPSYEDRPIPPHLVCEIQRKSWIVPWVSEGIHPWTNAVEASDADMAVYIGKGVNMAIRRERVQEGDHDSQEC